MFLKLHLLADNAEIVFALISIYKQVFQLSAGTVCGSQGFVLLMLRIAARK